MKVRYGMKYYFDIESEMIYTHEDLEQIFHEFQEDGEIDTEETFSEYLNNSMAYNNGSLDVFGVKYFESVDAIEAYVSTLYDEFNECYLTDYAFTLWWDDDKRMIDRYNRIVYEVKTS